MSLTENRNITFDLIRHAEATPNAPALLLPDKEISYGILNELTWASAQFLHDHGVREGDIVALTFADELNLALAMFAVTRLGATVFSIPQSSPSLQRKEFAARAQAKALLTDRPDPFDSGLPVIPIDLHALKNVCLPVNRDILAANPVAPWLLVIGSGSTGQPLLIPVTHAQENARSRKAGEWLGITAHDRMTSMIDMEFTAPKHRLHEALWAGASFCLFDKDTMNPVPLCRRLSLTVLHATVFHVECVLDTLPPEATHALDSLRILSLGSSTVSDDLRQRIKRRLCPNLLVQYSTNETGPITAAVPPDVFAESGTVGRPVPGVHIQIVNSSMQIMPSGKIGLVRVKSSGLIDGYFHDDATTRKRFEGDWFLPGDLGKLTRDGQLIHLGRADHMMIMGGINIYPAEIEQVMTGHPFVRDAAAIPVKHGVLQDVPVCSVVLTEGADITEQSLLDYARERLGMQSPDRIIIMDSIPRNKQGKLIRARLVEQIASDSGMAG